VGRGTAPWLTIDLGFAWTTLPGGPVAFVDVPGHERFVPNMLAGVGPVPAVLFVVAADEGWRAQSAEHLAALDALGVRHGLLAVTRTDLADPAAARTGALAHIARTALGAVPAVAVSGTTGAGLDALRSEIAALVARLPVPDPAADVRLWVDRSFTIRGAGTVVTGTLPAGTLRTGDELELAGGRRVRVRGLQALGEDRAAVSGVARVALNLRGVDHREVSRGDALLTAGRWRLSSALDVALRNAADLPTELVLHLGSAAVPARVRPLGAGIARLALARPLPLRVGDRGLLRDPGRHRIAAGLQVLDIAPPALSRRGAAALRAADLAAALRTPHPTEASGPAAAAGGAPGPAGAPDVLPGVPLAELHLRHRGFAAETELAAMGLPAAGVPVAGWLVDGPRWAALQARVEPAYEEWHRRHPLAAGMPADALRRSLGVPDPALLGVLAKAAGLVVEDGLVRRRGPAGLPAAVERAVTAVERHLAAAPFAAPEAHRLAELGLGPRELAAAVRAGRLVRIADGVVLLPDAPTAATRVLAVLPQPFTLSQARQALGTTRRVAVPLLELLARAGRTERLPDGTHRLH